MTAWHRGSTLKKPCCHIFKYARAGSGIAAAGETGSSDIHFHSLCGNPVVNHGEKHSRH